ncbi:hypothetical protein ACE6H2_026539 [Prunus campanulata]
MRMPFVLLLNFLMFFFEFAGRNVGIIRLQRRGLNRNMLMRESQHPFGFPGHARPNRFKGEHLYFHFTFLFSVFSGV